MKHPMKKTSQTKTTELLWQEPNFRAARLTEARVAAGLSMTTLAGRADLSAQSISSYESELREPSPDVVQKLADRLNVSPRYFYSDRPQSTYNCGTTFFRAPLSTRTNRDQAQWTQHALWASDVVSWLERSLKLPQPTLGSLAELIQPDKDGVYSEDELDEIAYKIRKQWNLGSAPIAHMVRLLESQGVFVVREASHSGKHDAFSKVISGRPFVFLSSSKESAVRSRFDAAHELGHLVLHGHITDDERRKLDVLRRIEDEADYFASAFLLPEDRFLESLVGTTLSHFQPLKGQWMVSIQAMIMRAEHLGLITEYHKQSLFRQMSGKNIRRREPLDDIIPQEQPLMGARAWRMIRERNAVAASRILGDLNLHPSLVAGVLGVEESELAAPPTSPILQIDFRASA
jgi:Zn-dependent peptidase ImmA (M78 family)/transcriptional regulator with XRE-family HTH domain